mmetsp:Transcript_38288/g.126802  ORF Transcript_38288/g.126802 Transcript_38288/m.126802 type:complete len:93 (+) Transcript_38288:68-346(+)
MLDALRRAARLSSLVRMGSLMRPQRRIGVDFALAKGVELARRRDFEADTAAALGTAHAEWRELMGAELARYVDVLVDDAVQLTANAQTSPRE